MKSIICIALLLQGFCAFAQNGNIKTIERPKLVVGIVIDQMRWDYLYRYYDKYTEGGFKRIINQGFSCENTRINYMPAFTAVGHASIFTGTVPSIHGIAGNDWFDQETQKLIYCTTDKTVQSVGVSGKSGQMSPRNLLVTSITDEIRIASNFHSKVVGISLKDRAAILPVGHNPTAAFWLDDASGNFITSSYYMSTLPEWVREFNSKKYIESYISQGWNTLLPLNQYTESTADNTPWEGNLAGSLQPVFPYDLQKAYQLNRSSFRQTPFGNTLTFQFAMAAVDGYQLGQGKYTDVLAVNCASTDYAGHLTGINSIEIEDVYLRIDRDLAAFFSFLDERIGAGNYLVFVTADHGAANAEGFMTENKMPSGILSGSIHADLEHLLDSIFQKSNLILGVENFQVTFNQDRIDSLGLDKNHIREITVDYLEKLEGIQFVVDQDQISNYSVPSLIKEMMINGYNRQRSGSIMMIPMAGWLPEESAKGTTHGVWNPYDTHIPLVFMGWSIPHGATYREVYMTDIASTLAALLHVQMPNGNIGKPIIEILEKQKND